MNIRPGKIENLTARRRASEDMLPSPNADEEVVSYLQSLHPKWLIHVESLLEDRARLEHSHW